MSELDLKKKAQELEQTLVKQLEVLKTDSQLWVKLGGTILISAVAAYTVTRALRGNKSKKLAKAIKELEKEGLIARGNDNQMHYQPVAYRKPSFWAPIGQRILMAAFDFGKAKLISELASRFDKPFTSGGTSRSTTAGHTTEHEHTGNYPK
jgi:ABC-type nickel/cobalt efflux system permease component RcnA